MERIAAEEMVGRASFRECVTMNRRDRCTVDMHTGDRDCDARVQVVGDAPRGHNCADADPRVQVHDHIDDIALVRIVPKLHVPRNKLVREREIDLV